MKITRVTVNEHHINKVWGLAKNNFSHREISKLVGIGRASVQSILKGKVTAEKLRAKKEKRLQKTKTVTKYISLNSSVVGRCKKCGALVHMPCRECIISELKGIKNDKSNLSLSVL